MQFSRNCPYNIEGYLQSTGRLSLYLCRHQVTHQVGILAVYNPNFTIHPNPELESQCQRIKHKLQQAQSLPQIELEDAFLSLEGYCCYFWRLANPTQAQKAANEVAQTMRSVCLEDLRRLYQYIRPIFRMICPHCGQANEAFLGERRKCQRPHCGHVLDFTPEIGRHEMEEVMGLLRRYPYLTKEQDPQYQHRTRCTFVKNGKTFWLWEDQCPLLTARESAVQENRLREACVGHAHFHLNLPLDTVSLKNGAIRRLYQAFPGARSLREHLQQLKFRGYFLMRLFHRLVELILILDQLKLIHGLFTLERFAWFDGKGGGSLVLNDIEGLALPRLSNELQSLELAYGYYPENLRHFADLQDTPHALLYCAAMIIFYLVSGQPPLHYRPCPRNPLPNLRNFANDLIPGFSGILTDCWLRFFSEPIGIQEVLNALQRIEASYHVQGPAYWYRQKLNLALVCDQGLKEGPNEDCGDYTVLSQGQTRRQAYLMVVADGVSGSCAGEFAARQVVETVIAKATNRLFLMSTDEIFQWMCTTLNAANAAIGEYILAQSPTFIAAQEQRPSGSTVVLGLIIDDHLYYSWAGDSRLYLLRAGQLDSLTVDDNWLNLYLKQGHGLQVYDRLIKEKGDELFQISRWIGFFEPLEHETHLLRYDLRRPKPLLLQFGHLRLIPADRLLLCTDGLSDLLSDDQIAQILRQSLPARQCCQQLVAASREAQKNYLNKKDNITCLLADLPISSAQ